MATIRSFQLIRWAPRSSVVRLFRTTRSAVPSGAVIAHPALDRAEVALPQAPDVHGAAAGPAGGDLPHIVTRRNAKTRLPEKPLLTGCVAGCGPWSPWNCPLPWREFLPPEPAEGIKGLGHDARGARAAVSTGNGAVVAGACSLGWPWP